MNVHHARIAAKQKCCHGLHFQDCSDAYGAVGVGDHQTKDHPMSTGHQQMRTQMTDPDEYPPYAVDRYIQLQERRFDHDLQSRREIRVVITCAIVAGMAIGGLLVAYGVF